MFFTSMCNLFPSVDVKLIPFANALNSKKSVATTNNVSTVLNNVIVLLYCDWFGVLPKLLGPFA